MRSAAAVMVAALLAGCAGGAATPSPPPPRGYASAAGLDALAAGAGTWRAASDPAASEALRRYEDADRWWLAIAHAELRPPEAAQHFDCVLGARLAAGARPALSRMMTRLLTDSATLTARLARAHPRPRPIAVDRERRTCQRLTGGMRDEPSWPAAGAVAGAAYGELFAALAPDRADAARAMGREIGASRAICAMNWPSDVADGQRLGVAVYEAAASNPDFAADLEAARIEVAVARAEGLTSPGCAAERRALRPGAG